MVIAAFACVAVALAAHSVVFWRLRRRRHLPLWVFSICPAFSTASFLLYLACGRIVLALVSAIMSALSGYGFGLRRRSGGIR